MVAFPESISKIDTLAGPSVMRLEVTRISDWFLEAQAMFVAGGFPKGATSLTPEYPE
jgi:hypothetical protein